MDWRWGEVYEEALKAQRPEEYHRLKASGELQQVLDTAGRRGSELWNQRFSYLRRQNPGPRSHLELAQHLNVLASMAREYVAEELLSPLASLE